MLLPILEQAAATVHLAHLDDLWFQITGTLCNLACRHCFISCSPHNHTFGFIPRAQVEEALAESVALGVKEYYFTGGEPFLHPDIVPLVCQALRLGPVTILTNATVLRDDWLRELAHAERESLYSLEFRVSLDGYEAERNDAVRGAGTFARTMQGVRRLLEHGFLPVITVAHVEEELSPETLYHCFVEMLRRFGYDRPRVKILPLLRLGAETRRTRGYLPQERVTADMLADFDLDQLLCRHARVLTDRGVYVCPILLEAADARLGDDLQSGLRSFSLRYSACYTCYLHGTICANASAQRRDL
ncbi:MAG: radical SAM protein [Gemmatales bacterium]|nr:radical SAM protein [Gemmatales bacterium]MDW8175676.1 radical SAM protein [Gemmatales bacterium]